MLKDKEFAVPPDVVSRTRHPATQTAQPTLTDVLTERGHRYGKFTGHAQVTQDLKQLSNEHLETRKKTLPADMQEALDMIYHKIGRIINGDHNYADSWVDIAGYAKLVADRLEGVAR